MIGNGKIKATSLSRKAGRLLLSWNGWRQGHEEDVGNNYPLWDGGTRVRMREAMSMGITNEDDDNDDTWVLG
jgi:hypothetical protein